MLTPEFIISLILVLSETVDTVSITVDVTKLIRRAQNGDKEAVSTLYQAYVRSIHRYILFRVRNASDADDLTAEVFIRMVQGLPQYQITEAPFAAWLYRIAANLIADFYRAQSRHFESDLPETLADDHVSPEEHVMQDQALDGLRAALMQLLEEHRTILFLRFVDRKSHNEVAAIMGKSMTAIKSAQHRALVQLTAILGADTKLRHYLRGTHDPTAT